MRWFRRKNDGDAKPEKGVKTPREESRGDGSEHGGNGAHAPQPNPNAPSWDVSALGLDRPEIPSSGEAKPPEASSKPEPASAHAADTLPSQPSPVAPKPTGDDVDPERLREAVIDVLRTVYDPEIPVNIYEIGLVYQLDVSAQGEVKVQMTLTSPMCPVAESLPPEVEAKIAAVQGVTEVKLDLVWDPPWNPSMMSEEARLLLNIG